MNKPGWQTTEMWITAITTVMAFLVAIGVISTGDATVLSDALRQIVVAVFALGGAAWVVINYIQSRTAVKLSLPPDDGSFPEVDDDPEALEDE